MLEHNPMLKTARSAVMRTQSPSVSALQRELRLQHSVAFDLIRQLAREGMFLCSWPNRPLGLHPDYRRMQVGIVKGDARRNYIERVVQLSLFFFELTEENMNGHSRLIREQLPSPALKWRMVQTQFRDVWYGRQRLSLTDAALAFHHWIIESDPALAAMCGIESEIRASCLSYERPPVLVTDPQELLNRVYVRLARFYQRMVAEDITQHSRVVEWFVPNATAPQNQGTRGQHPEHVVPCVALRDTAKECFENHWSIQEVARLLRRRIVVIWIEQEHRVMLDVGEDNLKNRMPDDWDGDSGCIYARLHRKAIPFTPATGYPCSCDADRI